MKVKFIHLSDARGKIGGSVASKNRGGNYFRSKGSPVNPNTTFQASVRSSFTGLSQAWKGLTQAQRATWISGANDYLQSNVFGDVKKLTGSQLYVRLNRNLQLIGATPLASCPSPQAVGSFVGLSAVADVSLGTIVINQGVAPSGSNVAVIYGTPVMSAGRAYVENEYRFLDVGDNASSYDYTLQYEARYGTGWKTAGNVFYLKAKYINSITGQDGIALSCKVVVVA